MHAVHRAELARGKETANHRTIAEVSSCRQVLIRGIHWKVLLITKMLGDDPVLIEEAPLSTSDPSIKGRPYRERSEVQSGTRNVSPRPFKQSGRIQSTAGFLWMKDEARKSSYGAGKVKNSHMGGAEAAAPGSFLTPRPSKVKRSKLGC